MWDQIRANRRRSTVLITLMLAVLLLLGAGAGGAFAGPDGLIFGVLIALVIFGIQWLIYATAAESVLLSGANAREITRDDSPQLFNIVEEMKIAAGLAHFPRIYLFDEPAPNAFAIGRKPEKCAVAVTTGLLHRLNRDELQGVIAHELAHIKNHDVHFMTLAGVMLGSIVILSEILLRTLRFGGRGRTRSDSRGGGGGGQAQLVLVLMAIVFAILGPLLAQFLYFACSRKREYLADACGAQFTRYPEGLAAALEKISLTRIPVTCANPANAPLFIVNPLTATGAATRLFATHPPTTERIRILRAMAGASLADYEQAYRRNTGTGLLTAGNLRGDTPQAIRPGSAAGPVETRQTVHDLKYRHHGYVPLTCSCGLELAIPPGYERSTIRCVRCSSELPIPAAAPPVLTPPTPQPAEVLQYKRIARAKPGWESFRCGCGRAIQLSPAFSAPRVRCTHCQRTIEIV
jgi:heat shock protein HtpX